MIKVTKNKNGQQEFRVVPNTIENGAHPYRCGHCLYHGETLISILTGNCVMCNSKIEELKK